MEPWSDKEVEDFIRQANWFMRGLNEQVHKDFKLDGFSRFDWNQWRGELVFSSGTVPKVVAPFSWGGDSSNASVYAVDKFVTVAERVMSRRHVALSERARRWLHAAHAARWQVG